jgi:hypothetical protein
MTELESKLLKKAIDMHSKIYPCSYHKEFKYCFTKENNKLYFWYNTEDNSTHVIAEDINTGQEKLCN